MASVKELFAKASVENAELQAEIESLITTVESKKTDGIPYARFKEKVDEANELKADLAEKEADNEKLKTQMKRFCLYKRAGVVWFLILIF